MKMNPEVICLGELLVEIMRTEVDVPHGRIGSYYKGPFPSGAPANFIDSVARMSVPFNISSGFIGVVGNDEFGEVCPAAPAAKINLREPSELY